MSQGLPPAGLSLSKPPVDLCPPASISIEDYKNAPIHLMNIPAKNCAAHALMGSVVSR